MVITINFNPALDRTVFLDTSVTVGGINRASGSILEAGGRGINVSRAVKALGGESLAIGFAGGRNGRVLRDMLVTLDIQHAFVDVAGNTRVTTKIIDGNGEHTDFREPGFHIHEGDFLRLLERIELLADGDATFVIAGSMPPGCSTVNYNKVCRTIRKGGSRMIVDADATFMAEVLKYNPEFLRVTRPTLATLVGEACTTDIDQIAAQARKLVTMGAVGVMVTTPKEGVIFAHRDSTEVLFIKSSDAHRDRTGYGISAAMLGTLAEYTSRNLDYIEMVKMTAAAGYATANLPGAEMPTLKRVFESYESMLVYTV